MRCVRLCARGASVRAQHGWTVADTVTLSTALDMDRKMRVGFRERPYDLYVTAALILILSGIGLLGIGGVVGLVSAILVVLFLPGYAVVAALFPAVDGITWLQRITLSIGISLGVVPIAGLLSNYTPWGIRIGTVLVILSLVVLGACGVAYVRRQRLPFDRRLSLSIEITTPRWKGLSAVERSLVVALAIIVVIASASLAYSATVSRPPPGFTEFYILNATGMPANYPTNLTVGEKGKVIVVVANHEHESINYTLEFRLTTLREVFNQTSRQNETIEVANVTLNMTQLQVPDLADRQIPFEFSINQTGKYALKFLLYVGSETIDSYRRARLLITVM